MLKKLIQKLLKPILPHRPSSVTIRDELLEYLSHTPRLYAILHDCKLLPSNTLEMKYLSSGQPEEQEAFMLGFIAMYRFLIESKWFDPSVLNERDGLDNWDVESLKQEFQRIEALQND